MRNQFPIIPAVQIPALPNGTQVWSFARGLLLTKVHGLWIDKWGHVHTEEQMNLGGVHISHAMRKVAESLRDQLDNVNLWELSDEGDYEEIAPGCALDLWDGNFDNHRNVRIITDAWARRLRKYKKGL